MCIIPLANAFLFSDACSSIAVKLDKVVDDIMADINAGKMKQGYAERNKMNTTYDPKALMVKFFGPLEIITELSIYL